ncbi:MAG: hypothetical protein K5681_03360 [Treponema sp.]|nr:hypothetical protein [Treponema sp.]
MSCSQNLPEIISADYSLVFEYANEEEFPSSRLCIFVNSQSDVRRYSTIKVLSKESGLLWESGDILELQDGESQWAGNVNLVPPEKEIIPSGLYEITFINADEEEAAIECTIKYDSSYYECLSADIPEKMKVNGIRKIAIYDENGTMLFFGNRNSELSTVRGIWNNYREAKVFQDIWCTKDNSIMCILPEEEVSLD